MKLEKQVNVFSLMRDLEKYYNTIQSGQNYVCVRLNGSLYVVEICTMCFIHSDVGIFRNQWIISSLSLISYCTPWYRWLVWTCEISQQVKSSFSDNHWCVLIKYIYSNFLLYNEHVEYRNRQFTDCHNQSDQYDIIYSMICKWGMIYNSLFAYWKINQLRMYFWDAR